MATPFQCPCGRALIADDVHRGLEVKCPACGRKLLVPDTPGAVAQESGQAPPPPATVAPASTGLPCPHCGALFLRGEGKCPKCGAFVEDAGQPAARRPGLPWEHRAELGLWTAAFRTVRLVLLEPAQAFRAMSLDSPLNAAFLFLVIFGCGGAVIGAIWNVALQSVLTSFLASMGGASSRVPMPISSGAMRAMQGVLGLFLAPFLPLFAWIITAGLAHLGLLVTGATRRDFVVTLAVFAYVDGAAGLFQILPFCGPLIGWVWGLICLIIGIVHAHGCETWKGALATLWPFLLCCCCGGGAAILAARMMP